MLVVFIDYFDVDGVLTFYCVLVALSDELAHIAVENLHE